MQIRTVRDHFNLKISVKLIHNNKDFEFWVNKNCVAKGGGSIRFITQVLHSGRENARSLTTEAFKFFTSQSQT